MKHKLKLALYTLSTVMSGLATLFFLLVVLMFVNDEDKSGLLVGVVFLIISCLIFVYFAVKFKKENGETLKAQPPTAQNIEMPISEIHNISRETIEINNINSIPANWQAVTVNTPESNPSVKVQNNVAMQEEHTEILNSEHEHIAPVEYQTEPEISNNNTSTSDINISSSELLLLKIDSVATSGNYFERVACMLLEANGYSNVRNTRTSNDYGIDILAEKDGISYAIQCKCYSSSVGNKAVQEAYSGKGFYNCMVAVVLTNSKFTKRAIETAKATQVLLWDRSKLTEMINALNDENIKNIINNAI